MLMLISSDQTTRKMTMISTSKPINIPATAKTTVNGPSQLSSFIDIIQEIKQEASPAPTIPEFVFEMTREAAAKNFFILKK